jgi:hypothetical protein
MNTPTAEPRFYEFRFPHLDTMLKLEVLGENATIFASRNTFSRRRKELFVRELALEGFIPEAVASAFSKENGRHGGGLRWLLDEGLGTPDTADAESQRLGLGILKASILLAGVFFVIVLGGSIYGGGSSAPLGQGAASHGAPMASR